MPYPILQAAWLSPQVRRLTIHAPHITRHCGPGQFVIVRATPTAERIPLTIAMSDKSAETVTLIIQAIGAGTRQLCNLETSDQLQDIVGPLGTATHIENWGHAVLVGGGVGTAVIYPQAPALKQKGNYVSAIIGGRTKELVILEPELAAICDAVYPCTDDGSHGFKGFVTQRLQKLIEDSAKGGGNPVKAVLTAGPVPMMRAVAELTRPYNIKTLASLNPIMVDGTGMCGGCRVQVAGQMKFACVDGPEFDAHQVDFHELSDRLTAYKSHEVQANERHTCNIGLDK
ncbi:MAG: sulfide/dihydroorotate dehydrogenase-like FAD/NAD-binding protein [Phycisphaerales bacterium]|nr:sulfide/dihydroorotate dehydrogenase-like FAD/NAD-binding protein [Phycisphaerales bacterium]